MAIRSAAKAVIVHDGRVLLNRCRDPYHGEYYTLPGGGQNIYETLADALVRECLEETGYQVVPLHFAALCETICMNEPFRMAYPEYSHKMLHIFLCKLANEQVIEPTEQDSMQIACEWISIGGLDGLPILPRMVSEHIIAIVNAQILGYLGAEHIAHNHG